MHTLENVRREEWNGVMETRSFYLYLKYTVDMNANNNEIIYVLHCGDEYKGWNVFPVLPNIYMYYSTQTFYIATVWDNKCFWKVILSAIHAFMAVAIG